MKGKRRILSFILTGILYSSALAGCASNSGNVSSVSDVSVTDTEDEHESAANVVQTEEDAVN